MKNLSSNNIDKNITDKELSMYHSVKTLKKTVEKLEQSNKKLEEFAYIVSHDLREPLRTLRNYLNILQKEYVADISEEACHYIDSAIGCSKRMKDLVEGLLCYSRIKKESYSFELLDCNRILEFICKDLEMVIKETKCLITIDKLPKVTASELQIRQIFQNLISNAIKFCKNKFPVIHISASIKKEFYVFAIKDNGIGINPKMTKRIFQVFQRLHTTDEYPGIGVGLSICKEFVAYHGGKIWLESEKQKGSTFYFSLPIKPKDKKDYLH